ncbi:MAG: motility protein A [Ilumatobacteraceae bacterium]|jgi:chemotaxis protein MotA
MPATLIGLLIALAGVFVGAITHHVSPVFLISNITALLIVIVGAFGATMASFDMPTTSGIFKAIMRVLLPKKDHDPEATVRQLVGFARTARSEGLLALEAQMASVEDQFLRRALQLAIDGSDPEAVADVMKSEVKAMKARHKRSSDWCQQMGIFAPTFGIIGAVIGLIATLGHLDKPEELGSGIASAFVATFWGVFIANGVMLPISAKMKNSSAQEAMFREMVMDGVLAIQAGHNPRVVEEQLLSFLPTSVRASWAESSNG